MCVCESLCVCERARNWVQTLKDGACRADSEQALVPDRVGERARESAIECVCVREKERERGRISVQTLKNGACLADSEQALVPDRPRTLRLIRRLDQVDCSNKWTSRLSG